MIKLHITPVPFFLFINLLYAPDTTKTFYFPHKTGDMWEYYYNDGPMYVDTFQVYTIFDSTDFNGVTYLKQYARTINPRRTNILFSGY